MTAARNIAAVTPPAQREYLNAEHASAPDGLIVSSVTAAEDGTNQSGEQRWRVTYRLQGHRQNFACPRSKTAWLTGKDHAFVRAEVERWKARTHGLDAFLSPVLPDFFYIGTIIKVLSNHFATLMRTSVRL